MGWLSSVCSKVLCGVLLISSAIGAACHGMLMEPRARNVVHNSNYCPHCLAAGGPWLTYGSSRRWPNSMHGVCGDPHNAARDHEAGGKFATNIITGKYVQGQTVTLGVKITAPHGGRFSFGVCPLPDNVDAAGERKAATQACFDSNPLTNAQDGTKFWWFGKKPSGDYTMEFKLPAGVTCKRCVLQWHYETGNSCTIPGTPQQHVMSANMVPCNEVGVMEEFWNCADISIQAGDGGNADGVIKKAPRKQRQKKKKDSVETFGFQTPTIHNAAVNNGMLYVAVAGILAIGGIALFALPIAGAAVFVTLALWALVVLVVSGAWRNRATRSLPRHPPRVVRPQPRDEVPLPLPTPVLEPFRNLFAKVHYA